MTFVSRGCLWNRAFSWGMAGLEVVCCQRRSSRVGACGMERLVGEWLGRIWCPAGDVRLEWVLMESSAKMWF